MIERRQFKRMSRGYVISYAAVSGADLKSDVSQTKNISEGGLLIVTNQKFEKGDVLKIKLKLPEFTDYVIVKAEVVDSEQFTKGKMVAYETRAKFLEIDQAVREAIRKTVDYA